MKTKLQDVRIIDIPKIVDPKGRGKLSVVEKDIIPFSIKRVYYLYDVPSDSYRGGHAHKNLIQFMIPLSGSFEVLLDDGINKKNHSSPAPVHSLARIKTSSADHNHKSHTLGSSIACLCVPNTSVSRLRKPIHD